MRVSRGMCTFVPDCCMYSAVFMEKTTDDDMIRLLIFLVLLTMAAGGRAQVRGLVVGTDTRLPLRDALVITDNGQRTKTDYLGRFAVEHPFRSASIGCAGYVAVNRSVEEMRRDTIFLLPTLVRLEGVVIYAPKRMADPKKWARDACAGLELVQKGPTGLNLLGFLSLFGGGQRYVSEEKREKQRRILEKY